MNYRGKITVTSEALAKLIEVPEGTGISSIYTDNRGQLHVEYMSSEQVKGTYGCAEACEPVLYNHINSKNVLEGRHIEDGY